MKSELLSGDTVMLYRHSDSENGNLPKYRWVWIFKIAQEPYSRKHETKLTGFLFVTYSVITYFWTLKFWEKKYLNIIYKNK